MNSGGTKMLVISIVLIFVLTGLGLFYVWRHHRVINMGAELGEVTRTYIELVRENDRLKVEHQTLRRSKQILDRAHHALGMEPANPERVFVVTEDTMEAIRRGESTP